jgi:type III pantothenate kinase
MLLVVDVGNTNVKTGLIRAGALVATRRAATRAAATTDEVELLLEGLLRLDGIALADVDAIAASSVVPTATLALDRIAASRGRPIVFAGSGTVPIAVRVDRPHEVGPDRLVNALAASRLHGTPAIVVDAGTAATFDCVAPDGAYVGGAIAPGLELGIDALATRTALLPRVDAAAPVRAIGRDTVSAIQAGAVLGFQALVEGLVGRIRQELAEAHGRDPRDIRTILTGGLSAAGWVASLHGIDVIDQDLTLKGLAILHAEVSGGEPLRLDFDGAEVG